MRFRKYHEGPVDQSLRNADIQFFLSRSSKNMLIPVQSFKSSNASLYTTKCLGVVTVSYIPT